MSEPLQPGSLRKWGRLAAGGLLFVAGVAMLVLPGPGVVTIVASLALVERDVPVARQLLGRIRGWWARREPVSTG